MSSATSIEQVTVQENAADAAARASRDTFRPWHFFVLASLAAATAAVLLTRDSKPEHLVLISVTIGAAGFAAAAFYRTIAPLATDAPRPVDGPMTDTLRAVLEREKLLVLRSIKELEFDRAMGKLSDRDFDEMAARLRARAVGLMRRLDADGAAYSEIIERELKARLDRRADGARGADRRPSCSCGVLNDPDAAFCKRCGRALAAGAARA